VPLRIDGLPGGVHRVSLQVGEGTERTRVFEQRSIELVPAQRTALRFDLEALLSKPRPWIRGHLILAASEPADEPRLIAHPQVQGQREIYIDSAGKTALARPASLRADGQGRYAFEVQVEGPGPHLLALAKSGFTSWVDVPPEGLAGLLLGPPVLLELEVACFDADSGQPFVPNSLYCSALTVGEHGTCRSDLALVSPGPGVYRLSAPPGPVEFQGFARVHRLVDTRFDLQPGDQRIELRFQAPCGVRLIPQLPDGRPAPPWALSDLYGFHLEPLEGQTPSQVLTSQAGSVILTQQAPGRYLLRLPELPAFEVPKDLEVVLMPGQVIDRVVVLVPRE
jgi:hypothetical protein